MNRICPLLLAVIASLAACADPEPGDPAEAGLVTMTWTNFVIAMGGIGNGCMTIPAGTTVTLDRANVTLNGLQIDGTLAFMETGGPVSLSANWITVTEGGRMQIGTAADPFDRGTAKVTLTRLGAGVACANAPLDDEVLLVRGGDLVAYGGSRGLAWTVLDATANPLDTSITVRGAPTWVAGDMLVIASTDFDGHQREAVTVTGVAAPTPDTRTFAIDAMPGTPGAQGLAFRHEGADYGAPSSTLTVPERAEVAVLGRSVIFTSVDAPGPPVGRAAGTVKVTLGMAGEPPVVDVEWAELTNLGETDTAREYFPLRLDDLGERGAAPVGERQLRHDSFHRNYYRAIGLTGTTSGFELEDNVSVDTFGHAFLLGGGEVRHNTLTANLAIGAWALPAPQVMDCDVAAAGFYENSPDNTLTANVAAGGDGHGFYLEPISGVNSNDHPGTFSANVGHSNGRAGFWQNEGYHPLDPMLVDGYTAYKNREWGLWLRVHSVLGQHVTVAGARMADVHSGFYFASGGWQDPDDGPFTLEDSLVIGETANVGTPRVWTAFEGLVGRSVAHPGAAGSWDHDEFKFAADEPILGLELYDGPQTLRDDVFADFQPIPLLASSPREAGAISQPSPNRDWAISPRNNVERITYDNAAPIYFRTRGGNNDALATIVNAIAYDRDGSTTGTAGAWAFPAENPTLDDGATCGVAGLTHACVAPPTQTPSQLQIVNRVPGVPVTVLNVARTTGANANVPLTISSPPTSPTHFATNLLVGYTYLVDWLQPAIAPALPTPLPLASTPTSFQLDHRFTAPNAFVVIGLAVGPLPAGTTTYGAERDHVLLSTSTACTAADVQPNVASRYQSCYVPAEHRVYVQLIQPTPMGCVAPCNTLFDGADDHVTINPR